MRRVNDGSKLLWMLFGLCKILEGLYLIITFGHFSSDISMKVLKKIIKKNREKQ